MSLFSQKVAAVKKSKAFGRQQDRDSNANLGQTARNNEAKNVKRILIIGATGTLARPVTEQLLQDGFKVTVLTTDRPKAERFFGGRAEIIEGDVTRPETLEAPIGGVDFVYLNLNSKLDPATYQRLEIDGTANVARLCAKAGVKRLATISGASSRGVAKGVIFLDAKVKAEKAILESGVPYSIMRPSWFYEALPTFVYEDMLVLIGDQPIPRRMLAAADYAKQVSAALQSKDAANRCFYNLGPEALPLPQAVERFQKVCRPDLKVKQVSLWMAKMGAKALGDETKQNIVDFFDYMETMDEDVDSSETDRILGKNETTLEEWFQTYQKQE